MFDPQSVLFCFRYFSPNPPQTDADNELQEDGAVAQGWQTPVGVPQSRGGDRPTSDSTGSFFETLQALRQKDRWCLLESLSV